MITLQGSKHFRAGVARISIIQDLQKIDLAVWQNSEAERFWIGKQFQAGVARYVSEMRKFRSDAPFSGCLVSVRVKGGAKLRKAQR